MFLVLVVHADYYSLSWPPDITVVIEHPVSSFMRYFVQLLALVCVNVFIIISGYFGIKVRLKSVWNFIFMVLFWRTILTISFVLASHFGLINLSLPTTKIFKLLIPGFDDWFVSAYVLLLFISPLLNAYIEKSSTKQLWFYFILYAGFQIILCTIIPVYNVFNWGYSVLSFMGLYVLGASIRRSYKQLNHHIKRPLALYIAICAMEAGIFFILAVKWRVQILDSLAGAFTAYNSLPVLLASFLLFLFFTRLSFRSRIVNYIAASSFAVYLFHMYPLLRCYYVRVCKYLFTNFDTWEYICLITLFIIGVYSFATVVDFVRRWLWKLISKRLDRYNI